MKWSKDTCLQAINLYRSKPEIWQQNHESYNSENAIDAWKDIAKKMHECWHEVYKIIESQLNTYMLERKYGVSPPYDSYTGKWFGYASCEFLRDLSDDKIKDPVKYFKKNCVDRKDKVEETPPTKKRKLSGGEGTSTKWSEDTSLEQLCNDIANKMKNYSKRTQAEVHRHIRKVLCNADEGKYDTYSNSESE